MKKVGGRYNEGECTIWLARVGFMADGDVMGENICFVLEELCLKMHLGEREYIFPYDSRWVGI